MKKRIIAVLVAIGIAIMIPTSAFAAETDNLPNPGTTPASPFYFMETWMQHMNLRFTFGANAKVQKALQYADEKLAEMEAMAEQNRAQHMERAANQYHFFLNLATQNMKRAMVGGNETSGQVAMKMSWHISVMTNNQNKGTEDCQQIRIQTRENAEECQENAIRTLAGKSPEEAIRLNLALMEQQCIRMNNCLVQEVGEEAGEALRQYERLRLMNNEIIKAAEQMGIGPEAEQMVDEAITAQNGTLSQVRNQFQIGSEGSPEPPLQNQTQQQEQNRYEAGDGASSTQTSTQEQAGNGSGYGGDSGAGQKR